MDERFPLGAPVNRPAPPDLVPIPNRPNWFRDRRTGREVYAEPPKQPGWPFPIAKSYTQAD